MIRSYWFRRTELYHRYTVWNFHYLFSKISFLNQWLLASCPYYKLTELWPRMKKTSLQIISLRDLSLDDLYIKDLSLKDLLLEDSSLKDNDLSLKIYLKSSRKKTYENRNRLGDNSKDTSGGRNDLFGVYVDQNYLIVSRDDELDKWTCVFMTSVHRRVCFQEGDGIFNKGYIMNVAFTEIQRQYPGKFDCFIFHDVDMLPEDDRNFYTCADQPRHIGVYINKFNYEYVHTFRVHMAIFMPVAPNLHEWSRSWSVWGSEPLKLLRWLFWVVWIRGLFVEEGVWLLGGFLEGGRRGWDRDKWVEGPELEIESPERLYPATGLTI